MIQLIQTYLPNVYKLGWSGQYGWGTAIYLTLYMTVISFIIGGFLGLVTGLLLVLTRPGGVIENRIVFQILDKITSLFRAIPFIILLAFINPLTYLLLKIPSVLQRPLFRYPWLSFLSLPAKSK